MSASLTGKSTIIIPQAAAAFQATHSLSSKYILAYLYTLCLWSLSCAISADLFTEPRGDSINRPF